MNNPELYQQLFLEAEAMTDDQLNSEFAKNQEEIRDFNVKLSPENNAKLVRLFNSGLYALDYQHAKFFTLVANKLKAPEETSLNLFEVRNIQNIIMTCKFGNPVEAEIIDAGLDSMKAANEGLYILEMKAQIYATVLDRRETEKKSGLNFSEEDTENIHNGEVRPDPLLEATKTEKEEPVIVEETKK